MLDDRYRRYVSLRRFTSLRAGGEAERLYVARTVDELADAVASAPDGEDILVLGGCTNVLPSDHGVPGLVIVNRASSIRLVDETTLIADVGAHFQDVFLAAAQAGLEGMEFAVGIPGSLGGAIVSNAGAYRSNIGSLITDIELVDSGVRKWVGPEFLQFSYRDSIIRRQERSGICLLQVKLRLRPGNRPDIYDRARDYQRQRISKQPLPASAGSFFKNVNDQALAESLENLPDRLKDAGVVPSGYLIEAVGLKGFRYGGALISDKHANYIVNESGAKAFAIRQLAEYAKNAVSERFDLQMEEEVLYIGDWSRFRQEQIGP